MTGITVPAVRAQPVDRTRAKRKAAWRRRRLVLLLMAPWLVGFSVFFGYPLVMSVYLSFTHYDLLSPPKLDRDRRTTSTSSRSDPQVGPAVKNTLWIIAIMVPLQVLFAFGVATMLRARAPRRRASSARSSISRRSRRPSPRRSAFVYILNPATGPVNILLQHARHRRPALVPVAGVVEAVADAAWDSGASGTS